MYKTNNIMKYIDEYPIYVTAHLLECNGYELDALDTHWENAKEVYYNFLKSEYNVDTMSEYDCIHKYIENL